MTNAVIFKIVVLLNRLGNLMICTHDLIILAKTKEMIRYCESFGYGDKSALKTRFYYFNAS
jgi:hypothetical protein